MLSSFERATLYFRRESFGCVVFNPLSGIYWNLGSLASAAFLEAAATDDPQSVLPQGLVCVLRPCESASWTFREVPYHGPKRSGLRVPIKAFVNITRRCNLFCRHCYNSSGEPNSPELSKEIVQRLLEQLSENGIFKVTISGGEPLFHLQSRAVLKCLVNSDISFSMISNGLCITEAVAQELGSITNLRSITISIDGSNAADNDELRGEGSFEGALRGLKILQMFFDREICVRATITSKNAAKLVDLPPLLAGLGVRHLKINRLNPYGRASGSLMMLEHESYTAIRDRIIGKAEAEGMVAEIPAYKYQSTPDGNISLCRAGEETLEVDADGAVYPCSFSFGRFLAGNVCRESLSGILLRLQEHSINNLFCMSCRGRGGKGEKTAGYVPKLMADLARV